MTTEETHPWDFCGAGGVLRSVGRKPDTTTGFPRTWRIFGPLMPETVTFVDGGGEAGGSLCEPGVSADIADLTAIPERLTVGDQQFEGRDLKRRRDTLDFGALYKLTRKARGYNAYAMAEVTFGKPTEVTIGTGSDYWMQWWVDGKEVLSTLRGGNDSFEWSKTDFGFNCRFEPGPHLIVVRSFSGSGGSPSSRQQGWVLRAGYLNAREAVPATRNRQRWEVTPELGLMLPPRNLSESSMAIRTDLCLADETIECDFILHSPEGQFGLVFGAQDRGHYYWAYLPRWGQNWRARAVYAAIARVDGTGHARNVALMLMPGVPAHWNARLSMKVVRRGDQIQMYMNGVKGPFAIDDTYGAGWAGVSGHTDYRVTNLQLTGTADESRSWPAAGERRQMWFQPDTDTGYGKVRQTFTLLKLHNGDLLAGICSQDAAFFTWEGDKHAQVRLYLSRDAGRSWQRHGDALPAPATVAPPAQQVPYNMPWGIRWFEPKPGVIRAFCHGPAVKGAIERLKDIEKPEDILSYRDSDDQGLTWTAPQPAALVGNWSKEIYRTGCHNHVYGFTQLRDGTLLTLFLHHYSNDYKRIRKLGEGTWGTNIAQPYVSRSEDNGLTWQVPVPMDNAALFDGVEPDSPHGGWSETAFAELPSGRIVAVCRPYRSPYGWQTHSDDGGRTWQCCTYLPFSPSGGPQMIATQSGYLAVVSRETGLGLHTSVDGGVNWDAGTLLDHDCWFNGFMVEAEPDVALIFYFCPGRRSDESSCPRMQRVRITKDGPVPEKIVADRTQ